MNPAADPAFVAAEVDYRFERDRIIHPPTAPARRRRHGLGRWLRPRIHRSSTTRRHPARARRA